MLEPRLWDRFWDIKNESDAFWTCDPYMASTDEPVPDDAVALSSLMLEDRTITHASLGNYVAITRSSAVLRPDDRTGDPIMPDASLGNYSKTARSSADLRPLEPGVEPIRSDPLLRSDSVTAMDDRGQGGVVAVIKAEEGSMGENGNGDAPLASVMEAMALGNKSAEVCSELCDDSEVVSYCDAYASAGDEVDRFTIDA